MDDDFNTADAVAARL
ncbi:MAG: hypothetical protein ACLRUZ_12495 [Faecalimonas sp.]